MTNLEAFIHQQAAPLLCPGESIQNTGCLLRVTALTPTLIAGERVEQAFTHEPWLVALTQTRMILFLTQIKRGFLSGAPQPLNLATTSIPYDTLRHMKVEAIRSRDPVRRLTLAFHQDLAPSGIAMLGQMTLTPEARFSSRERTLVFDLVPAWSELEGQAYLYEVYISTLADLVTAGEFPLSSASRAQAEAFRKEREQYYTEQARLKAERAELRRRNRPRFLRNIGLSALAAACLTLGYFAQLFLHLYSSYTTRNDSEQANECLMLAAACGIGVLLTIVLITMLWRRKLPVVTDPSAGASV